MNLKWSRSATKHRISRERSRHVIEHCGLVFEQEAPADAPLPAHPRLLFLGDDPSGIALEVMAIELEKGGLQVIHAMRLRDRYRTEYEESKRWRR